MIRESIIKLSKKQDLTYQEAEEVMDEIMSGKATPVQMSAYLTALSLKGETIQEITASAAGMRALNPQVLSATICRATRERSARRRRSHTAPTS